jgi:hypothetical protein
LTNHKHLHRTKEPYQSESGKILLNNAAASLRPPGNFAISVPILCFARSGNPPAFGEELRRVIASTATDIQRQTG